MNDNASPSAEQATAFYKDLLRPVFARRKFLLTGPIAVGLGDRARRLLELGAERPLLIAGSAGTGAMPGPGEAELHLLGVEGGKDMLEQGRKMQRALDNLPARVQRAVDVWDPSATARCVGDDPAADPRTVAGRRCYAARPLAWAALEDKVRVDAFWDAVGVQRAPSRVVPTDYSALRVAARILDRGSGTVWAADARDGLNGGGLGLRWVRSDDDGRESYASLSRISDRVRVMPFLEGIPASIHGIVFPDAVAVFRPVEMVVLRPGRGDRLLFAGCATAFDPNRDERDAMRQLAYRVGAALRERFGYRGPFGIDGILAEEGFLPTEMNARSGGGLKLLAQSLNGLPLWPLCLAITEGEQLDYRPDQLEQTVVESADAHRTGAGWSATRARSKESATFEVVRDGHRYRRVRSGEIGHGTVEFGPGPMGGFLRFTLRAERIDRGSSFAPEVVRAFRFADRVLGTDFGRLEAARNARR